MSDSAAAGGGQGRPVRVDLLAAEESSDGLRERVRVQAASWRDLPEEVEGPGGRVVPLHLDMCTQDGGLRGCLSCGHPELYTRKDFPPALGIAIVIVAAALVPFTPRDWRPYYPSLVAAVLIDYVLFRVAPDVVLCYQCSSKHSGFAAVPRHPGFDRTIEERLRYGERAVMGSEMRPGGTADAPEPEH